MVGSAALASAVAVSWYSPLLSGGGYSSEAISFALDLGFGNDGAVPSFGAVQFAEHVDSSFERGLPPQHRAELHELLGRGRANRAAFVRGEPGVAVCHSTPDVWHRDGAFGWGRAEPCPPPGEAVFAVGRTMYETDRIPSSWVASPSARKVSPSDH